MLARLLILLLTALLWGSGLPAQARALSPVPAEATALATASGAVAAGEAPGDPLQAPEGAAGTHAAAEPMADMEAVLPDPVPACGQPILHRDCAVVPSSPMCGCTGTMPLPRKFTRAPSR